MNREQAKFLVDNIEVLKAYAEGKTIQFKHKDRDGWKDVHDPSFCLTLNTE